MNKTLLINAASSIFWTFIIICIMTLVAACNGESNKTDNPTGVWVTHPNTSLTNSQQTIIQIKDYRRNLQWDAFQYGHSIIIVPGTEKPIKNVEYTP